MATETTAVKCVGWRYASPSGSNFCQLTRPVVSKIYYLTIGNMADLRMDHPRFLCMDCSLILISTSSSIYSRIACGERSIHRWTVCPNFVQCATGCSEMSNISDIDMLSPLRISVSGLAIGDLCFLVSYLDEAKQLAV